MADKIRKVGDEPDHLHLFHCPGCKRPHPFDRRWTFNGSMDKPTFSPSLLVERDSPENRCHSFVREGRIEFCGDCHHELAGQIVDLPDWDEETSW